MGFLHASGNVGCKLAFRCRVKRVAASRIRVRRDNPEKVCASAQKDRVDAEIVPLAPVVIPRDQSPPCVEQLASRVETAARMDGYARRPRDVP